MLLHVMLQNLVVEKSRKEGWFGVEQIIPRRRGLDLDVISNLWQPVLFKVFLGFEKDLAQQRFIGLELLLIWKSSIAAAADVVTFDLGIIHFEEVMVSLLFGG